jgi:hypothetical protein
MSGFAAPGSNGRHHIAHRIRPSIIIWHYVAMADDLHLPLPRCQPQDINLGCIKTELEFLIDRVSKLPTRQELALRPLCIIAGSAGLVIP